jgi:hypothetical protein
MASVDLLAGTVMDAAAALLNDPIKSVYTYAVLLPYLQLSMQELQEVFEINSIPVSQVTSAIIPVDAGQTQIIYNGVGVPTLPSDFVEPNQLWERQRGIDPYTPMTRLDYLPHYMEGSEIGQFVWFTWNDQVITVLPANRNNDIKIDYIRQLFTPVVDQSSIINIVNAASFLEFETAAFAAEFVERNEATAAALSTKAVTALDRATGIGVKGKQSITVRRRPFRSGYKRRSYFS